MCDSNFRQPRVAKPFHQLTRWSERVKTEHGFLVPGVADGETCVRLWNPDMMHGTLAAAIRHATPLFPCVHRVVHVHQDGTPVREGTDRPVWVCAPPKKQFARWAKDYVANIPNIPNMDLFP